MPRPAAAHSSTRHTSAPRRLRGFTLVELLVAVALMALMAGLSWRALDGMTRAQQQTAQRSTDAQALQTALAQWRSDLNALVQTPWINALDFDGLVLRMTRTDGADPAAGLTVVAWSLRTSAQGPRWLRWQSPTVRNRAQLEQAWAQAALWAVNPSDLLRQREVDITPASQWQIFYFRNNAWSNPQSSATAQESPGGPPNQALTPLPDGVRLVLTLPAAAGLAGTITLDWVRPTLSGAEG